MAKLAKQEGFDVVVVANGYMVREIRESGGYRGPDATYVFETFAALTTFLSNNLRNPAE